MSAADRQDPFAPTSSSAHSGLAQPPNPPDGRDELDFLGDDDDDDDDNDAGRRVLNDDPIHDEFATPISFKRKQKPSLFSSPGRLLSALTGDGRPGSSGATTPPRGTSPAPFSINASPRRPGTGGVLNKDGSGALDWNVEGPGRRVGYDDLTAIDWIFEYTKERQRLRVLTSNTSGLVGYVRQLLDASQVWVVMILTGLAVGAIAALINVTTDWLGDLKLGFCSSGPEGGHFYLNKSFCCYGYDQGSKCTGWRSWGEALGVQASGGKWIIEYIFFLSLSVSSAQYILPAQC